MKAKAFGFGVFGVALLLCMGAISGYPFNPKFGTVTATTEVTVAGDSVATEPEVAATYLTQANASSTYLPLAGGTLTGALEVGDASDRINFVNNGTQAAGMKFGVTGLQSYIGGLYSSGNMALVKNAIPTNGADEWTQGNTAAKSVMFEVDNNGPFYLEAAAGTATGPKASFWTSNKVWHAGNDGAGSTLDADTLDAVNSTSFARVDAATNFTTAPTISSNTVWHAGNDGDTSTLDADRVKGTDIYWLNVAQSPSCAPATSQGVYPAGWTFSEPGVSGQCRVTHSIGSQLYSVQLTPYDSSAGLSTDTYCYVYDKTTTYFDYECLDSSGTRRIIDNIMIMVLKKN